MEAWQQHEEQDRSEVCYVLSDWSSGLGIPEPPEIPWGERVDK